MCLKFTAHIWHAAKSSTNLIFFHASLIRSVRFFISKQNALVKPLEFDFSSRQKERLPHGDVWQLAVREIFLLV